MSAFRVALSGDFLKPGGNPAYPSFDLGPLTGHADIETAYVDPVDGVMPSEALEGFDALILLVPRFGRESVPKDGRLAMIARFGVGYDSVDLDACNDAAIAAVTTPDGVRRAVAVSVITFVLALAGKLLPKDRICREGPDGWARRSEHMGVGLMGKTLGQLGMGNIGAEVFRMAAPFGMSFIAHDPWADARVAAELGVRLVSEEEVFRQSDFLSISVPLSDSTRGLVDAHKLALMKPTAYLINTSRGPVCDQPALYDALENGVIAGAGLDVFTVEPPPADEPILALDNVICAPHALCWTDECFRLIGKADVDAVLAMMHGQVPGSIVNKAIVDNPSWQRKLAGYRAQFGALA